MKRVACVLVVGVLVASLAGCTGGVVAPVSLPGAFIINYTTVPLDTDMNDTKIGSRRGSATAVNILGLFSFGNAGIDAAARAAGIQVISYADCRTFSMFMLFNSYTTVVYGD